MRLDKPITTASLPKETYSLIPEGECAAVINNVTAGPSKNNPNTTLMLTIEFKVGKQFLKTWVIIESTNPKAVESGQQKLRQLLEACGMSSLTDTDDLISKHVTLKIKHKPNSLNGEMQAEVQRIKKAPQGAGASRDDVITSTPSAKPSTKGSHPADADFHDDDLPF